MQPHRLLFSDIFLFKTNKINGCGVLVVSDGKVLTGTRIDGKHKNQICGPGGHIEYGEDPEQAAIREAREEFDIECKNLKPLGILDGGRNYGKSAIFLCTEFDGEPATDEEEMTDCKWRTVDELRKERLFKPFEQSLNLLNEHSSIAKTFKDILKFNPYHDRLGRFSNSGGATSFTYKPGQGKMYDNAIARERERIGRADKIVATTSKNIDYIIDQGGISTGKEEVAKQIQNLYTKTSLNNGIAWNDETQKVSISRSHLESVKSVARDIMSKQEYEDNSTADEYRALHHHIKSTPINISDYDKQNIPDWNDYRKGAFGNLTISRNGISIDSFYQELSTQYPHLFNSVRVTNPADQLQQINDTLKNLKPKTYRLSGKQLDDATNDLALTLISGYVSGMRTAS